MNKEIVKQMVNTNQLKKLSIGELLSIRKVLNSVIREKEKTLYENLNLNK